MTKVRHGRASELKTGFAKRLGQTMNGRSVSAFSMESGVSESLLRKYLAADSLPGTDKLVAIARASDVALEWLATGEGPVTRQRAATPTRDGSAMHEFSLPPLLEERNGEADETHPTAAQRRALAFETAWLEETLGLSPRRLAMLRVTGDFMHPTLDDGDLLLIDTGESRLNHDGLYVLKLDQALAVRRVQHTIDGPLLLKSDNPAYEDERLDHDDASQLRVVGRVVWGSGKV